MDPHLFYLLLFTELGAPLRSAILEGTAVALAIVVSLVAGAVAWMNRRT